MLLLSCDGIEKTVPMNVNDDVKLTMDTPKQTLNTVYWLFSSSFSSSMDRFYVSECGFRYVVESSQDTITLLSESLGRHFSASVSIRDYGKTINCRAFISNGKNTVYSNEESFHVNDFTDYVSISRPSVTKSFGTGIVLQSRLSVSEGVQITEKGFLITRENGAVADTVIHTGTIANIISADVNGLVPGNSYSITAYVKDNNYTAYSESMVFSAHSIPSVTTVPPINIDAASVVVGGMDIKENGLPVTEKGVVWNLTGNPDISLQTRTCNGGGTGNFTDTLKGLLPNTIYYIRAYATNSDGTGYGDEVSFRTMTALPTVVSDDITDISSTSFHVTGNVVHDGGDAVTERGFVWSLSEEPEQFDNIVNCGIGDDVFEATIYGLTRATTYYIRAFATNSAGTSYGSPVRVTTLADMPVVGPLTLTGVTDNSIFASSRIEDYGGSEDVQCGFVWDTGPEPSVQLTTKILCNDEDGLFLDSITGLIPATTYHVRAFVTNTAGTVYSEELSFRTIASKPGVITTDATSIGTASAIIGGNVIYDGGEELTDRGVIWSNTQDVIGQGEKLSCGTGTGDYAVTLSGLSSGTTYYYMAYAQNSIGTTYGDLQSFTTNKSGVIEDFGNSEYNW